MRLAHVSSLDDYGTRSLLIHGIMVIAFANAVFVGLFVEGIIGVVSFVALLNFTAGLWVAQSINSLGNAADDDGYEGVLNELIGTDRSESDYGVGRFGRLTVLIASVTAIALLTSGRILSGQVFSVAVVAIGAIAVVTAMIGFLVALGESYDDSQKRTSAAIDRNQSESDSDEQTTGDH